MRRALIVALMLVASPAAGAEPPLVDYVVQPGEDCPAVALKLFGDRKYIALLHQHNKLGPLPHRLKPGMVLRVPQQATPVKAGPDAVLTFLRNRVDAYTPEQHPGERDEPLQRGHKVSTLAASSAEVTFADESRLQLGEDSLVIILGSTRTQAQTRGGAEDTTLVRGSLRASLGALAGKKPAPLALATPAAEVVVEPGEAQVTVDAKATTRVAVHRGKARVTAQKKAVQVPEQHGSKAEEGKPPTPPRPLPAAPVWVTRPPPLVLQTEAAAVIGAYAPGAGLAGAAAPASWRVQVARDERFNDIAVDTRVPAAVTELRVQLPAGGTYFARVSGIDGDEFEGRAGEAVRFAAARIEAVPAAPGRPGQVMITPGTPCALGDAPLAAITGPLTLRPGGATVLRCAADATGAGAVELRLGQDVAGPPTIATAVGPVQREGGDARVDVEISASDAAGAPLDGLALLASADAGVQVGPVGPGAAPGRYRVTARWAPSATVRVVRVMFAGAEVAKIELPAIAAATAAPLDRRSGGADGRRLGPAGKVGVGLLAGAAPLIAIGFGFTFAELQPYHDDPLRRRDLRPTGLGMLVLAPALVIGGSTLLIMDAKQRRRVRVAPTADRTGAGLVLFGRF